MKKIMIITFAAALFVFLIGYCENGYFSIGAELPILLFLPVVLWVYKREFKEDKSEDN